MQELATWRKARGHWQKMRAGQAQRWFEEELRAGLLARLQAPEMKARMQALSEAVACGEQAPAAAAKTLLDEMKNRA